MITKDECGKEGIHQSIAWNEQGVLNLANEPDIFITISHGNVHLNFRCPCRSQDGTFDGCIYKRMTLHVVPGKEDVQFCAFETHCSGCLNKAAQDAAIMTAAKFLLSQVRERLLGL